MAVGNGLGEPTIGVCFLWLIAEVVREKEEGDASAAVAAAGSVGGGVSAPASPLGVVIGRLTTSGGLLFFFRLT